VTENEIRILAGEYFPAEEIESVKVTDKRVIVTLRNVAENQ